MRIRRSVVTMVVALLGGTTLVAGADPLAGLLGAAPEEHAAAEESANTGPALTEREAVVAAKARQEPVEVLSRRTERSQTFVKPDGTLMTDEYIVPQWVKSDAGEWIPTDPSLKIATDGSIKPSAITVDLSFSSGGDAPMAAMVEGARSLGFTWPHPLPAPSIDGNVATYRDVAPDVDLQIVADVAGFTHLVVLKSPEAAQLPLVRELVLRTSARGLSLRVQSGAGVVEAVAPDGTVVFDGPTPIMWDSSAASPAAAPKRQKPSAAAAARGRLESTSGAETPAQRPANLEPKTSRVAASVVGDRLVLRPDLEMLTAPDTVYPVYIDPTWSKHSDDESNWTLLRKSFPNTSHWNRVEGAGTTASASSELDKGIVRAGYSYDSVRTYTDRSLFHMNLTAVKYKTIHKATFSITQAYSWWNNCSMSNPPITDLRIVNPFNSGTTWNNQPSWGSILASSAKIRKYGLSGCGPQRVEFNITNRVAQLAGSGQSAMYLGLRSRNDSGVVGNWTRFRLRDLKMTIEYNSKPNAASSLMVSGKACATGSGRPHVTTNRPNFQAYAKDPDSAQQLLTARFYWWVDGTSRGSDYVSDTSANPGTAQSASIPSDKALTDQTVYKYQAQILDDAGGVSWSSVCEFQVALLPPNQPSQVSSTDYPAYTGSGDPGHGGVGVPGSFSVSPPGTTHQSIAGYAYSLDGGAPESSPFVASTGSAQITIVPRRAGLHTLQVWTKDVAGLYSTPNAYQFKVREGDNAAAVWEFEGADAGHDASEHGNTLTLSGGAATVVGRAGVGSALDLNGLTSYASRGAALVRPHPDTGAPLTVTTNTTFSVAAWVKLDATGGAGIKAAVSAPSTSSAFVLGYSATDNKWVFQMSATDANDPAVAKVLSDATAAPGQWTHLAGTYDMATNQLRLYVMGVVQTTTATLSGSGFHAAELEVGRYAWNGTATGYLDGQVDDVRVYPYLAPATEFTQAAKPIAPVISFPDGPTAVTGGTLRVRLDAKGDLNVTSFTYSLGTPALDQTATPDTPGGTVVVEIPVTAAGATQVYAASVYPAPYAAESPASVAEADILPEPKVTGVVYNAVDLSPVAGATVQLDGTGLSVVTGVDGSYTLTGFQAGTYILAAYVGGQCGMSAATEVVIAEAVTQDLYLLPLKDTFGYECVVEPGSPFAPASGSALSLTGDDAVAQVALPFQFPFYDGAYDTVWVDTNGFVTFSDPGGSHAVGERNIPAPAVPNNVIAAYWDDLVVDSSASVVTESAGSEFVIEWRDVYRKNDPAVRFSAQLRLADTGFIFLNYAGLDTVAEQGESAVVGIESRGGEIGIQYSYKQPVLADDTMVVFVRPPAPDPIARFTINGTVTEDGLPVSGLEVKLEPAELTAITAPDGSYSFTDLEGGSYYLSAGTDPHCGKYANVHVQLVATTAVELALEPLADSYGNECLGDPRTFEAVSAQLALSGDDAYQAVSLPFPVGLYGQGYTTAWIDTNGVVSLTEPDGSSYGTSEIPSAAAPNVPNTAVYAFWDDWVVDASASVWTGTSGTAPARKFAVEWRDVAHAADATKRVSFQAVFHETGEIIVAWDGIDANPTEQGATAVVGIENSDGTEALAYAQFQPVIASGDAVVFQPGTQIGTTGTLSGTVTCAGVAAEGVVVAVAGKSVTTAADGGWQLSDIEIGAYTLIATASSGACAGSTLVEVNVAGGVTSTVNVALAPATGYTVVAGPRTFEPVDSSVSLSGDEAVTAISVPFPVALFGRSHLTAWADTNGLLSFAEPAGAAGDASAIPSAAAPNAAVYPFWEDLIVGAGSSVWTGTTGSAPTRKFVVEWRDAELKSEPARKVSFQVVFHETGEIAFAWDDLDEHFEEQGGGTVVGIENGDGTIALAYSQFARALRSGNGVLFQPDSTVPLTGSATGVVTCGGNPVEGATVTIAGLSAATAAGGGYTVAGVPVGTHTAITTWDAGACKGSTLAEVTVVGGSTTTLDVTMAADTSYVVTAGTREFLPALDALALSGDDNVTSVSLPFTAFHYGEEYDTAWVDTNGVLSFTDPGGSVGTPSALPSAAAPNAAVYAFWDNWNVGAESSVWTGVSGTSPDRRFVVEWRDVRHAAMPGVTASFQVVLHENGDVAVTWTGLTDDYTAQGGTGIVGIENANGAAALSYSQFAPTLRSGQGVLFSPVVPPVRTGTVAGFVECGNETAGYNGYGNVLVKIAGRSVTTVAGAFEFQNVPAGTYTITAVAPKNHLKCPSGVHTLEIVVVEGNTTTANFRYEIYDPWGAPKPASVYDESGLEPQWAVAS